MVFRLLKSLISRFLETIVSVIIVMLFFSLSLLALTTMFPSGTSLRSMAGHGGDDESYSVTEKAVRDLLLAQGSRESGLFDAESVAAVLTMTQNKVKSKRANSIAWRSAKDGMSLYDHDAVQTFRRSSAEIKFDENSYMHIGDNSLIIIKRLEKDIIFREKRSFIIVADGEFQGKSFDSKQESVYVEIATPTAVARIRTDRMSDDRTDFKVNVKSGMSSIFTINKGLAEVESKGKKVQLKSNQMTYVDLNGVISAPRNLPEPLKLDLPLDSSRFYYRDLPPKILFSWKARHGSRGYRFIIARDPFFEDVIVDEHILTNKFAVGNLRKGAYFWRATTLEGVEEGVYGETRKFTVIEDREPPVLVVQFPPGTLYNNRFIVKGETDADAHVFIEGKPVEISDEGTFQYGIRLQNGVNVVVVEAVDRAGNVTYRSQLINARF